LKAFASRIWQFQATTGVPGLKKPKLFVKLATVASSVLLVGGFVSYRAGAINWVTEPGTEPADSRCNPAGDENLSDDSKSGPKIPKRTASKKPSNDQKQKSPTIMVGSKSFSLTEAPFPPSASNQPPVPSSPLPSEKNQPKTLWEIKDPMPTIMPGSKAPLGLMLPPILPSLPKKPGSKPPSDSKRPPPPK
jgi:hypothetical protein